MKNIVVCCDGTWNNRDRTNHPTSVARIARILEQRVASGDRSLTVKYVPGVGARDNLRGLRKTLDKWRGGALGRGLDLNIRMGYRHIVANYEPGDKIFIFGFSRGAYTARSLGGLIRSSGIVKHQGLIKKVFRRYRNSAPETSPRTEESMRFRAEVSPQFYTNETERKWRESKGITQGDPIQLAYLGVFDTVGTYGVPGVLSQLGIVAGGHGFHDLELSSMVQSGWHAVGLDERRILYKHTPWDNLPILNSRAGPDSEGGARYREQWFPGVHGKIGGSGAERRISNSVLEWILEGAGIAGLDVDVPEELKAKSEDYAGDLGASPSGLDPSAALKRPRKGPKLAQIDQLHPVALLRLQWREDYRPKSLKYLLRTRGWQRRVADALGNTRFASIKPGSRQA